jgi:Flp pilus assembly protein TadD
LAIFPNRAENYCVERNFRLVRSGDRSFNPYLMRIWMIAAVAALALGSLAAENVAPTKSELEEMYGKAFRQFDANNFPQALKELDAIDARQPDLAASKNLRGVILMRQGVYDKAEAALLEAARLDPKFWNARFNLAEIPFLKKDWAAARSRFEELISSSESDLASEASQLIQYKILLTYLLEGKENMVDSILAKLELSRDTPAVDYVKAAVALQHKNQKEAKDWMTVAEKNFSPQLNKLFAESLYEVGWLERPAGEARASLPLTTAAERAEKGKALARSKFEQAQQALRQRDFVTARKLVDEADQAQPNQPATLNLRGEILMEQKQFGEAEAAFKKAAKLDPKFREAQYNLAQIPFKNKDYAKARERLEALLERTPGGDKNQAAELMRFKIYMTLLLEGKESRAQAMMEKFQFTGDTPALYYAQAAWEFKHSNPEKAADWTASAKKIYSPALNSVFAEAFYDVGWMQSPEPASAPEPALDTGSAIAAQAEGSPAVEPSPIPDALAAANKQAEKSKGESSASSAVATSPPDSGTQTTSVAQTAEEPPASASTEQAATETGVRPEEAAGTGVSGSSSEGSITATASPAEAASAPAGQSEQTTAAETKPSVAPAVPSVQGTSISQPGIVGLNRRTWVVIGLLLAGIFVLAWAIVPGLRRRYSFNTAGYLQPESVATSPRRGLATAAKQPALGNGLFGGPRQISLRLTASKPSLRQTALPSAKSTRSFDGLVDLTAKEAQVSAYHHAELREMTPVTEPLFESESVGPVIEYSGEKSRQAKPESPSFTEPAFGSGVGAVIQQTAETSQPILREAEVSAVSAVRESSAIAAEEPIEIPTAVDGPVRPGVATRTSPEPEIEPIGQEYALPHEEAVTLPQSALAKAVTVPAPGSQAAISAEPEFPQTTTPATMPEPTQTPPAPITKPPMAPVSKPPAAPVTKPQPAATMQTSVQLTFSFEISAMQLTPSFKMGSLNVRPISKVVTMRLAPSQQPQPAMQVSFEIAKIQPLGSALGTIRMVPSQQRPPVTGSSSVAVAGMQVVSNSEAAPVQLTPSQPGQATVFVTVPCQITTIEFAPSLEIASVVLNSNSKQVRLQLPGAGPNPREGAPTFEITNLQLGDNGDIAMMHLNLLGSGPRQS